MLIRALEGKQFRRQVLILNHNGGEVFNGQASLTNIEQDLETGCLIADCKVNGQVVLIWRINRQWQGWI